MAYIEDNLQPDEHVVARARLHWILFLFPIACLTLGLSFVITAVINQNSPNGPGGHVAYAVAFLTTAAVSGAFRWITYITSEFGVTNKRILTKVGFIRRTSREVLLSKVEGIDVHQSVLGRILDYGSIVVSGTGGSKDPFPKIAAPLAFRREVLDQITTPQRVGTP